MSIKVKAKKIVVDGQKWVEIQKVCALSLDSLPHSYVKTSPSCWTVQPSSETSRLFIRHDGKISTELNGDTRYNSTPVVVIDEGMKMSKSAFGERMAFLSKCGERLTKLKKQLETTDWDGDIKVKI